MLIANKYLIQFLYYGFQNLKVFIDPFLDLLFFLIQFSLVFSPV